MSEVRGADGEWEVWDARAYTIMREAMGWWVRKEESTRIRNGARVVATAREHTAGRESTAACRSPQRDMRGLGTEDSTADTGERTHKKGRSAPGPNDLRGRITHERV